MKIINMPYPVNNGSWAQVSGPLANKILVQKTASGFVHKTLVPMLDKPRGEDGIVIDESAPAVYARDDEYLIAQISTSELNDMASIKSNAYTVWLLAVKDGETSPVWVNKFAETYISKHGFRVFWNNQKMLVLAQFWIPPFGLEPSLVFMTSPDATNTQIEGFTFDGLWETNSVAMAEAFPMIRLSRSESDPAKIGIEVIDGDGSRLAVNGQIFLESSAGALSNTRPILSDGFAEVSLIGADAGAEVKVKAGFKWYTGVEELEFVA